MKRPRVRIQSSESLIRFLPPLVGGALVAWIAHAIGARWIAVLTLGILFTIGACLWLIDSKRRPGELGQGVFVGVVVSLALLVVQRDADQSLRKITDRQQQALRAADLSRERAQERQNLSLTLTRERRLQSLALERSDLSDMALAGKDFSGARLDHAVLDRADLGRAVMRKISATGAKFRSTWLQTAHLDRADLRGADFDGANLQEATLRGVKAAGANFADAWMTRVDLRGGDFVGLQEEDDAGNPFGSTPVPEQVVPRASFFRAQLHGANLSELTLTTVDFHDARLRHTNFQGSTLDGVDFRGATLGDADLRDADLSGATLCAAVLDGARLDGALFTSDTRWPRGTRPERRGAVRVDDDELSDDSIGADGASASYPAC
jgi:uncharacterized protein YjbI with pentapeptide repeats